MCLFIPVHLSRSLGSGRLLVPIDRIQSEELQGVVRIKEFPMAPGDITIMVWKELMKVVEEKWEDL